MRAAGGCPTVAGSRGKRRIMMYWVVIAGSLGELGDHCRRQCHIGVKAFSREGSHPLTVRQASTACKLPPRVRVERRAMLAAPRVQAQTSPPMTPRRRSLFATAVLVMLVP